MRWWRAPHGKLAGGLTIPVILSLVAELFGWVTPAFADNCPNGTDIFKSVSVSSVTAGSTSSDIVFQFQPPCGFDSAATNGSSNPSEVYIVLPAPASGGTWTKPQTTTSTAAGYVSTSIDCTTACTTSTVNVVGAGTASSPWIIVIQPSAQLFDPTGSLCTKSTTEGCILTVTYKAPHVQELAATALTSSPTSALFALGACNSGRSGSTSPFRQVCPYKANGTISTSVIDAGSTEGGAITSATTFWMPGGVVDSAVGTNCAACAQSIPVYPSTATSYTVTNLPSSATAGTSFNFNLAAKDAYGNTVNIGPNNFGNSVTLTTTDPQASSQQAVQFTSGTAVPNATLKQATTSGWTLTVDGPTCTLSGGGGTGATCSPTVGGAVSTVALQAFGSGYTSAPTCTISGGGGAGATCGTTIASSGGTVQSVTLTAAGSGYTSTPTCTISGGGGGTGATCTITLAGSVTAASVTAGGSGYTTPPTCALAGNSGSGATCTAAVSGGAVTSISITAGGSGYNRTVTTSLVPVNPGQLNKLIVTPPASATAGSAFSVTVSAADVYNNTVTSYSGTVVFSSTDSSSNTSKHIPSNYTFVPATDHGTKTFSTGACPNCFTLVTSGNQSITATDNGNSISGIGALVINPAGVNSLAFSSPPSTASAGGAFVLTTQALDQFGNLVTSYNGTVSFSSSDSGTGVSLPVAYQYVPATDAGSHGFSVTLAHTGAQTVTATDGTRTAGPQTLNVTTAQPATHLAISVTSGLNSGNATAGQQLTVQVTAQDQFGNTATTNSDTINITSTDPNTSGMPANAALVAGSKSFQVTLKTSSATGFTITACDTNTDTCPPGTQSGTVTRISSSNIPVLPGSVTTLSVSPSTGTPTDSTNFSVTVTAKDSFNNTVTNFAGTVSLTSTDPKAPNLATNYVFTTSGGSPDNGVHTFTSLQQHTSGAQTLSASTTVNGVTVSGTTGITVAAGPAASLAMTSPATATAGTSFSVTITAKDVDGNVATGYLGTVTFSSSDTHAVLPSAYPFVGGDAGTHTFTNAVTLNVDGSQTVSAGDGSGHNVTSSPAISVSGSGPAASMTITNVPATAIAGSAFTLTVSLFDSFGNAAAGYTGTVQFTTTDPDSSGLPSNYTYNGSGTGKDNGVHSFSVTLKTGQSSTVTVTDTVSHVTATTASITVSPGAVTTLGIVPSTGTPTANTAFTVTVTAKDAFNNTATNFTGTVSLTSTDPKAATLATNYLFTTGGGGDNGVHTFTGLKLHTAGAVTISASTTVNSLQVTGTTSVTVGAGPVAALAMTSPATAIATSPFSVTVTATDVDGNRVSGYTGHVTFSSTDTHANLPSAYTFTLGDAGSHTFSSGVTLNVDGNQTLTVGDGTLTFTTPTIAVSGSGPGSTLTITHAPASISAGTAFTINVSFADSFGNPTTGYVGTVHFTTSDPNTSGLPSDYTFAAGDNGTHAFQLSLFTAGTRSLTVTDTLNGALTGTVPSINVQAGTVPTQIVFSQQPVGGLGGAALATQPILQLKDVGGNLVNTSNQVSIAIAAGPGGANLGGTTNLPASGGVATFTNLTLDKAGTYQLVATSGGVSATSSSLVVSVGPESQLVITQQALGGTTFNANFAITPALKVAVEDAGGNVVTASSLSVTIALSPAGTLNGTATQSLVNGIATFNGLSVGTNNTYHFVFTASGTRTNATTATGNVATATGNPFNVTPVSTGLNPGSGTAGTSVTVTVTGFLTLQPVTLTFNGSSESFTGGANFANGQCTTDNGGSFACTFVVPPSTSGAKTIAVSDGSNTASSTFNVTNGGLTGGPTTMIIKKISPSFGPVAGGTLKDPSPTPPTPGQKAVKNAITITGSGFQTASGIMFGNANGNIVSINSAGTVMKAIPPAGTGAVQVQVLGSIGNSDNSTASSLYFYGPQITSLSPSFTNTKAKTVKPVTIHGHNLAGVTGVTFVPAGGQSSAPTGGSVSACTPSSSDTCMKLTLPTVGPGAGAYYVELTGSRGSSDISSQMDIFSPEIYAFGPSVTGIAPLFGSASGGNKLTIRGHGFTGATSVHVGSNTISTGAFTIKGDTTITVSSLPAQAASDAAQVNVSVTGANGDVSAAVAKSTYSYGPVVTNINPKVAVPGSPTKVTITGKNFLGATAVHFGSCSTCNITTGLVINSKGTSITLSQMPNHVPGAVYITVEGALGPTDVSAPSAKSIFNFY